MTPTMWEEMERLERAGRCRKYMFVLIPVMRWMYRIIVLLCLANVIQSLVLLVLALTVCEDCLMRWYWYLVIALITAIPPVLWMVFFLDRRRQRHRGFAVTELESLPKPDNATGEM
jgi:hypothetical protein